LASQLEQDKPASFKEVDVYAVDRVSIKLEELLRIPIPYHNYLDIFDAEKA
jgi:hypothetical protein